MNAAVSIEKYLQQVRARGRYSFTLDELRQRTSLSYRSVKQNLYYLKSKKYIAQIRQGFYVILFPEYTGMGTVPVYQYIGHLMKSLDKPYYIGLLSAAALHGAAHQKVMVDYIVTQNPAPRNINSKNDKLFFISKNELLTEGIIQKKSRVGYINVSSPELTAFDLLDQIRRFGLNHITTVLQELHEVMKASPLKKIALLNNNTANIQRLGYILENFTEGQKLADALYKMVENQKLSYIPLSPVKKRVGTYDTKWKIIVNTEIDPDL
ncbi:MAG: type IV toxin-antitoxin system AbiEi family antitoxin [Prevotellaceae bacterium]|jgi:predicted transcriptional regulator of viral defense system|nr:type IV toxin-antitoxin system AbiEi family antitoxin [Prevotellaceae bacterium]